MLAKRTSKNQITLPKDVLREFGSTEYFDVHAANHQIILRPVDIQPADERLRKVREKIQQLGLTESDIQKAIRWARK